MRARGAELRLSLGHTFLTLPAAWGVYGSGNAGRVYLDGDSPIRLLDPRALLRGLRIMDQPASPP